MMSLNIRYAALLSKSHFEELLVYNSTIEIIV